jgi:hypothetical protein
VPDVCECSECNNTPTVATSHDPIYGVPYRVCAMHASLFERLDNHARYVYRMMNDYRAERPPLVVYDAKKEEPNA